MDVRSALEHLEEAHDLSGSLQRHIGPAVKTGDGYHRVDLAENEVVLGGAVLLHRDLRGFPSWGFLRSGNL